MPEDDVFRLPPDAKEFTQEDARTQRYGAGKARIDSSGAVRADSIVGEKFRKLTPGELLWLRTNLSKSVGLATLFKGDSSGIPVRSEIGNQSVSFAFGARLQELEVEIPEGWAAVVDAWVQPKVEGIEYPCLMLDIRNREMVEVEPQKKKGAGDQNQDKKGTTTSQEKKGAASDQQTQTEKNAAAGEQAGEQKGSAAGEQPEETE